MNAFLDLAERQIAAPRKAQMRAAEKRAARKTATEKALDERNALRRSGAPGAASASRRC